MSWDAAGRQPRELISRPVREGARLAGPAFVVRWHALIQLVGLAALVPPTFVRDAPSSARHHALGTASRSSVRPNSRPLPALLTRAGCTDTRAADHFFPKGVLIPGDGNAGADEIARRWFSAFLAAIGASSLSCGEAHVDSYRLLVLPSFSSAHSAQLEIAADSANVSFTALNGQGGWDPGAVQKRTSRTLLVAERLRFERALASAAVWAMPTFDYEGDGLDGTEYVLEARSGDRYHVTHRWMPKPGAFRTLCELMTTLGGG